MLNNLDFRKNENTNSNAQKVKFFLWPSLWLSAEVQHTDLYRMKHDMMQSSIVPTAITSPICIFIPIMSIWPNKLKACKPYLKDNSFFSVKKKSYLSLSYVISVWHTYNQFLIYFYLIIVISQYYYKILISFLMWLCNCN